jgi:molybdopterin synthase catalytic subunit
MFLLSETPLDLAALRRGLDHPASGAIASFEGVVRNHNQGRSVLRLGYQAYAELALREGAQIIAQARAQFDVHAIACTHRIGVLEIGEVAVWAGASAAHRDAAFAACRWLIDEVKRRVPIWKQEHYADGVSEWLHPQ